MSDTAKLDNAPPERMPTEIGLRHLRYVELSATCGSFRKAAVTLGVQQSAVSRRIRDLEDALGAALFIRHSGGVVLTEAGTRWAFWRDC